MRIIELIDTWIDWNEKKIKNSEFTQMFREYFKEEIHLRILQRRALKKMLSDRDLKERILTEMTTFMP